MQDYIERRWVLHEQQPPVDLLDNTLKSIAILNSWQCIGPTYICESTNLVYWRWTIQNDILIELVHDYYRASCWLYFSGFPDMVTTLTENLNSILRPLTLEELVTNAQGLSPAYIYQLALGCTEITQEVTTIFQQALSNLNVEIRASAIEGIYIMGSTKFVPNCLNALSTEIDPGVRAMLHEFIGRFGSQSR